MSFWDNAFGDGYGQYRKFMGQGQNAIDRYTNKAARYVGEGENYLSPYRDAGEFGLSEYEGALSPYGNPLDYEDEIESHYQMSPGAKFRLKYGMNALKGKLAGQGLGGSGAEDTALTNYTQGVISQDLNDYIKRVLGIGKTGLEGYGNLARMGEEGAIRSGDYAMHGGDYYQHAGEDEASIYSALANAAAQHQQNVSSTLGDLFGSIPGDMIGAFF